MWEEISSARCRDGGDHGPETQNRQSASTLPGGAVTVPGEGGHEGQRDERGRGRDRES